MSNLQEITGQESGIVVYEDAVIVANWSSYETGLPVISPFGTVMEWPEEQPLEVSEEYYVDDIRTVLPGTLVEQDGEITADGMDILADDHGDIPALWGYELDHPTAAPLNTDSNGNFIPTPGMVYRINDAIVVVPDGWN
jgi:hypothetical protein